MVDALTAILKTVRMTGSVFSRAELGAPWAVESGQLGFGIFHAVVRGSCWMRVEGGDPFHLERGDIVLVPSGANHILSDVSDGRPGRVGFEGAVDEDGMGRLTIEGDGPHTSLLCGTVEFDSDPIHPTLSQLPEVIHVGGAGSEAASFVETCIRLIAGEIAGGGQGSETVVARLTDVIIVYALREYLGNLEPGHGGWLGALGDPHISRALALIHTDPTHLWTIAELARNVGMSRSNFFARFRDLVGETPGQYLTRWRVHLAARLLRQGDKSVATAGRAVGYATEAAFSNAFLRMTGMRPGAYRRSAA